MADDLEIKGLKDYMETLNKIEEYLPEKENIKTIPKIFKKTYDENFISDFIAYVLDPNHNGVGIEPLIRLVEGYSDNGICILKSLKDKPNLKVEREYTLSNGRRIDILIKVGSDMIIGIENKIFSTELENQTKDYANSINKEFPNYESVLLFLTPKGIEPVSGSFLPISYSQLISKLRKVDFNYRDDIRRKIIFDEFILHVEEYIMNKKSDIISEQTKLYIEYYKTIKKLEDYYDRDSIMVFEEFEEMVKDIYADDWQFNISKDRGWHTIYKKHWDIKDLFIHHEFWISARNILIEDKLLHFIEIEGKDKEIFFTLFGQEYEKIKDEYKSKNIKYRPPNRKHAIAYRELDNYFKFNYKGENILLEEINKCKFINEAIERVYKVL